MKNKILLSILIAIFIYIPNVSAWQITVKKDTVEIMNLEVESSDTVEAVKQKIYEKDNSLLIENQKLTFGDSQLEEGRTLADYNIQAGNTIMLSIVEQKYKVTLDANGGKFNDLEQYIIEEWDNSIYDNLVTPTKEGYTFKGYYTEKIGGTKFELILAESGIDSDKTFYAQWEENSVQDSEQSTPSPTPTQPETTNNSTTSKMTEEIENPETGENINLTYFMVSSIIVSFLILNFIKKQKKECK